MEVSSGWLLIRFSLEQFETCKESEAVSEILAESSYG